MQDLRLDDVFEPHYYLSDIYSQKNVGFTQIERYSFSIANPRGDINMLTALHSSIYKFTKAPILFLTFLWPIPFVAAFLAYYSVALWSQEDKISGYFQVLALVIICIITFLCTYIAQQEQHAGGCFNLLCIDPSRIKVFFSLFLLLLAAISISTVISVIGFAIFWGHMQSITYVLTAVLLLFPTPALLLIHMVISFKFGTSWSVGFGAAVFLVAALGITNIFGDLWHILPPTWSPRFVSLMILDVFHPGEYIRAVAAELRYTLSICLIFSLITLTATLFWFKRWDGRPDGADE